MSGMGDLFTLMKNAKQMMEKAKAAQADLAQKTVAGQAGAGLVVAKVNGLGELLDIDFDICVVNPGDVEMLTELIVAAVADARQKTADARSGALDQLTGGIDLSALGIDKSGLF